MNSNSPKTKWITMAVFLIGVAMIGFGIARGEAVTVMTKATSICMQCIGIN
ncbi:MAG: thioredoxin [Mogibacterium sp.]|nr:thioredoxin [Mogibacterium sp.]